MKNKWWIVLVIIIMVMLVLGLKKDNLGLTTPNFNKDNKQTVEVPNATPNAPKQYDFDQSTDLKKELDSINPVVYESDFE